MSRYIDADALCKLARNHVDGTVDCNDIMRFPAIDAVPVVRCRECKWRMIEDAADAIERLMDEIDRKDKALQAWVNTWDNAKGKLIDRICENCDTPPDVRLRVCGECPIIQPIREVFDE